MSTKYTLLKCIWISNCNESCREPNVDEVGGHVFSELYLWNIYPTLRLPNTLFLEVWLDPKNTPKRPALEVIGRLGIISNYYSGTMYIAYTVHKYIIYIYIYTIIQLYTNLHLNVVHHIEVAVIFRSISILNLLFPHGRPAIPRDPGSPNVRWWRLGWIQSPKRNAFGILASMSHHSQVRWARIPRAMNQNPNISGVVGRAMEKNGPTHLPGSVPPTGPKIPDVHKTSSEPTCATV